MSQANVELVLKGYWAFVGGDLETVADMLDPDIEWIAVDPSEAAGHEGVLSILADRFEDGYRVEIERCVGIGDDVAVSFRVAGEERDETDDRPLADAALLHRRPLRRRRHRPRRPGLPRAGVPAPRSGARGGRARRRGALTEPQWWEVRRRVSSRRPATYRCPFCNRLLHAMSDHVLIAPEGDSTRRRHAHAQCVAACARGRAGSSPTTTGAREQAGHDADRVALPPAVAPIVSGPCASESSPAAATAPG